MARITGLNGKIHKYHTGAKFTNCGKRIRFMIVTGTNNPKKHCSACWR